MWNTILTSIAFIPGKSHEKKVYNLKNNAVNASSQISFKDTLMILAVIAVLGWVLVFLGETKSIVAQRQIWLEELIKEGKASHLFYPKFADFKMGLYATAIIVFLRYFLATSFFENLGRSVLPQGYVQYCSFVDIWADLGIHLVNGKKQNVRSVSKDLAVSASSLAISFSLSFGDGTYYRMLLGFQLFWEVII